MNNGNEDSKTAGVMGEEMFRVLMKVTRKIGNGPDQNIDGEDEWNKSKNCPTEPLEGIQLHDGATVAEKGILN